MILFTLSDTLWLEVMIDLEDLGYNEIVIRHLKFRQHLTQEKRSFGLYHLAHSN